MRRWTGDLEMSQAELIKMFRVQFLHQYWSKTILVGSKDRGQRRSLLPYSEITDKLISALINLSVNQICEKEPFIQPGLWLRNQSSFREKLQITISLQADSKTPSSHFCFLTQTVKVRGRATAELHNT